MTKFIGLLIRYILFTGFPFLLRVKPSLFSPINTIDSATIGGIIIPPDLVLAVFT